MMLRRHKVGEDIYENNIYTQTPKSKQLTWYRETQECVPSRVDNQPREWTVAGYTYEKTKRSITIHMRERKPPPG